MTRTKAGPARSRLKRDADAPVANVGRDDVGPTVARPRPGYENCRVGPFNALFKR